MIINRTQSYVENTKPTRALGHKYRRMSKMIGSHPCVHVLKRSPRESTYWLSKGPEGIPQWQPEIYIRIMSKIIARTENLHVRLLFQDIPDLARDKSAM